MRRLKNITSNTLFNINRCMHDDKLLFMMYIVLGVGLITLYLLLSTEVIQPYIDKLLRSSKFFRLITYTK